MENKIGEVRHAQQDLERENFLDVEGTDSECVFRRPLLLVLDGVQYERKLQEEMTNAEKYFSGIEDDRLLVLIGDLLVENAVDNYLMAIIQDYEKILENRDFTFSMRIGLARAMRFSPVRIFDGADVIRKVRNAFVHNLEVTKLARIDSTLRRGITDMLKLFTPNARDKIAEQPLPRAFKDLALFTIVGLHIYKEHLDVLDGFVRSKKLFTALEEFHREQSRNLQ